MHDLAQQISGISRWISGSYPPGLDQEAHDWRRIHKAGQEAQEALEAYCGMIGENPRKGVTSTLDDVIGELLDTAGAALGAVEHLTGNEGVCMALFATHMASVHRRAGLSGE